MFGDGTVKYITLPRIDLNSLCVDFLLFITTLIECSQVVALSVGNTIFLLLVFIIQARF